MTSKRLSCSGLCVGAVLFLALLFLVSWMLKSEKLNENIQVNQKQQEIVFDLTVDYTRSLNEGIKSGNYDSVNQDITEKNFPSPTFTLASRKVTFKLFHFNRGIESNKVILKMKDAGCRPANIQELLVFGQANPKLQMGFPIIELGSVWEPCCGDRSVVCLRRLGPKRTLELRSYESDWGGLCRFLAVSN